MVVVYSIQEAYTTCMYIVHVHVGAKKSGSTCRWGLFGVDMFIFLLVREPPKQQLHVYMYIHVDRNHVGGDTSNYV